MSKTVNGEWWFDDVAKEVLRRQVWQVSDYCGIEVVTHTEMVNHFHVVVRVPKLQPVSDAELLRRYGVLYPKPTARLQVIASQLAGNGPEAVQWRQRQLRLMGDVSQFMKLLKQRFSIWFNKTHSRFGPVWSERFKSVLVGPGALQPIVAYVDLNCVRAGLVTDPKEYRFCGYAEAVAGNPRARAGLQSVLGVNDWKDCHAQYRMLLFGTAGKPRAGAASLSVHEVQQVIAQGGSLPLAAVLRCRIRYFTAGAILGSPEFVAAQTSSWRGRFGSRTIVKPRPLPAHAGLSDLAVYRNIRGSAIG